MLKTGMIIAERYEILGKIGTGGMADEIGRASCRERV